MGTNKLRIEAALLTGRNRKNDAAGVEDVYSFVPRFERQPTVFHAKNVHLQRSPCNFLALLAPASKRLRVC